MSHEYDVVVVGAGPAGLAAVIQARELGLTVALIDEQPAPGGQIYRGVEQASLEGRAGKLGNDYTHGLALAEAARSCGAVYLPQHQVWQVERDGHVYLTNGTSSRVVKGRRLVVAVGAMERPVPIRGWTLPGVMTVGSAQILLKTISMLPGDDVWIAGSGPLVLAYAAQIIAAGGRLAGILDTSRRGQFLAALKHWRGAARGWRYLLKGLRYVAILRMSGLRIVSGVQEVEALGDSRIRELRWRVGSKWQTLPVNGLLLHEGVIPNTFITQSIGCGHTWDFNQQCFRPSVDQFGETDVDAVYVAGDCAGIGGAHVAELSGRLASIAAYASLNSLSNAERELLASPYNQQLQRHLAIRPFLDTLYSPAAALLQPADDVVVCRCEGITAGRIREAVKLGCRGPNQVKSFTRCGMGPCQGRMCGPTLTTTIAGELRKGPQEVGSLRVRPPLKPLKLAELASLASEAALPGESE